MGAGRSGSTLLDILMGNLDRFFSAGELNRFSKRGGIPHDVIDLEKKIFWEKFKNEFELKYDVESYEKLYSKVKLFEYHSAFFRNGISFKKRKKLKSYYRYNLCFFEVLSNQINEDYIIDSSKYPMRGYYLNKCFPGRVSYIYLKRRPSDVVKSFAKKDVEQPSKNWFEANLYLLVVNFISTIVFKHLKRNGCNCAVISFNELTNNPVKTFESLGSSLGFDTQKIVNIYKEVNEFSVGYLFDGNRLRQKKNINLRTPSKNRDESFISSITNFIHRIWWRN